MRNLLVLSLTFIFAAGVFAAGSSFSQEEETLYSSGVVKSIDGNAIVISEMVYEETSDQEVYEEFDYIIMADAELDNVDSIASLKEGQMIDFEYMEQDGKNQISHIYLYSEMPPRFLDVSEDFISYFEACY